MNGTVADAKELFWLAGGALAGLAAWVGWVLATAETRKGPMVAKDAKPAEKADAPAKADADAGEDAGADADADAGADADAEEEADAGADAKKD